MRADEGPINNAMNNLLRYPQGCETAWLAFSPFQGQRSSGSTRSGAETGVVGSSSGGRQLAASRQVCFTDSTCGWIASSDSSGETRRCLAEMQNLYNHRSVIEYSWNQKTRELYAEKQLGLLPVVGINVEF